VLGVVLGAALIHAAWNALVRGSDDKLVGILAMVIGHVPLGLVAIAVTPAISTASIPYVFSSSVLHSAYAFVLMHAYRHGDLTHVYPIARGVAPALVTIVSVGFLNETIGYWQLMGVVAIVSAVISLGLVGHFSSAVAADASHRATLMAVVTGCFIAAYSLNDGLAARVAGSPWAYYGWVSVGQLIVFGGWACWHQPTVVKSMFVRHKKLCTLTGGGSFIAYGMVIWAYSQAPLAVVSALRETSIIFALLIGVLFLGERFSPWRVLATMLAFAGVVAMRLAG